MTQPVTRLFSDYVRRSDAAGPTQDLTLPGPATTDVDLIAAVCATVLRHTGQRDMTIGLLMQGGASRNLSLILEPTDTLNGAAATVKAALAVTDESPLNALVRVTLCAPQDTTDARFDSDPPAELVVGHDESGLRLAYDPRVFAAATAQRFARDILSTLARLAGDRTAALIPLPPPVPAQRAVEPAGDLADHLTAAWAGGAQRVALASNGRQLSAAQFADVTSQLAATIRQHVSVGERVAVLVEHDVDAPIAVWSVLKAGAAYVPLDPRLPDTWLARIATDARVGAVVCSAAVAARARSVSRRAPVIVVDADDIVTRPTADLPLDSRVDPAEVAYLLHTSGSTGRPKAIVQTRRNVLAHARCYIDSIGLAPTDHAALLAPVTFDAAVMDLFGATLSGATLHVLDALQPAEALLGDLAAHGVTVLHCTPTLLRHLLGADLDGGPEADRQAVSWSPRIVVLGGEELDADDVRRLASRFPDAAVVNGLGPSECTLALQHRVVPDDECASSVPVGQPVAGVDVELVDETGRQSDISGELVFVTDRVAAGYWNLPELTAASFWTGPDGRRRYRTGDLAWRRSDGAFVFVGRRDRQVKIRGYRVEMGQVESVLRTHPTVAQAAVTVDYSGPSPRLIAYATPATAFALSSTELLAFLARQLPAYEVPAAVVAIDAMPLGPTGKLDRAHLPAVPDAAPQAEPCSDAELRVVAVWQDVLSSNHVSVEADFLSNGGDSLQMLAMLAEVEKRLWVRIELPDFLARPTVATIAGVLEQPSEGAST